MKLSILIVLLFLLASCAIQSANVNSVEGKALLIAEADSIGKVLIPLSTSKHTRIEKINGERVSNLIKQTQSSELEPGKHSVEVSCNIYSGGLSVNNKKVFDMIFELGKTYVFSTQLGPNSTCIVNLAIK